VRVTRFGSGPLVVQLAGIVGGVELYREAGEALARHGFEVALLDTAGDRRDDPAPGRITWDFLVSEVAGGLDALGAERAILYGTSFGCLVALATAARHPRRVRGLLLAHPPDPFARPFFLPLLRWAQSRPNPVRATRRLFDLYFTSMVAWEFASPAALRRLPALAAASARAATPARTLHEKLALLWAEPPGLPPDGVPVSILTSPWDLVAPLSGARRLAERLPGARMRVLPFTGHSAHYSRPRAFARVAVEEARRIAGAAAG
jgi:pimeloyl-ACP methyl ester carboxylesterase